MIFLHDVHLCAHRGKFCEWSDCDFSSANSVCKHSCDLLFSAAISLAFFLRRWQRWGNYHAMALPRKDQSLTRFLACFKKPTSRLFLSTALS